MNTLGKTVSLTSLSFTNRSVYLPVLALLGTFTSNVTGSGNVYRKLTVSGRQQLADALPKPLVRPARSS